MGQKGGALATWDDSVESRRGLYLSIIAATAIVRDEPVLTRTVDHFERIDDVEIRSY